MTRLDWYLIAVGAFMIAMHLLLIDAGHQWTRDQNIIDGVRMLESKHR